MQLLNYLIKIPKDERDKVNKTIESRKISTSFMTDHVSKSYFNQKYSPFFKESLQYKNGFARAKFFHIKFLGTVGQISVIKADLEPISTEYVNYYG